MIKYVQYILESIGICLIYLPLRLLPFRLASDFGGWAARQLGPATKVHQTAVKNLRKAMPDLSEAEQAAILIGMWDNLGRVFCEYPHLPTRYLQSQIEVTGSNNLEQALQTGRPVIFISGHMGNWELLPVIAAMQQTKLHLLYRPPNNPLVDWLINRIRSRYAAAIYAKGSGGARGVIRAIRARQHVAILVDQKTNDGEEARFFGYPAMTTTVVAHLVLHYNAVVLPAYCKRVGRHNFNVIVEPLYSMQPSGDRAADAQAIIQWMNDQIERWVRAEPEQWFWVHKRWRQ